MFAQVSFQGSSAGCDVGAATPAAGACQYRFDLPRDVEGLSKLFNGNLCEIDGKPTEWTSHHERRIDSSRPSGPRTTSGSSTACRLSGPRTTIG